MRIYSKLWRKQLVVFWRTVVNHNIFRSSIRVLRSGSCSCGRLVVLVVFGAKKWQNKHDKGAGDDHFHCKVNCCVVLLLRAQNKRIHANEASGVQHSKNCDTNLMFLRNQSFLVWIWNFDDCADHRKKCGSESDWHVDLWHLVVFVQVQYCTFKREKYAAQAKKTNSSLKLFYYFQKNIFVSEIYSVLDDQIILDHFNFCSLFIEKGKWYRQFMRQWKLSVRHSCLAAGRVVNLVSWASWAIWASWADELSSAQGFWGRVQLSLASWLSWLDFDRASLSEISTNFLL